MAALERGLQVSGTSTDALKGLAGRLASSPLSRGDARRELLLARLASRLSDGSEESGQRVRFHVMRSADRSPGSPWLALNAALSNPPDGEASKRPTFDQRGTAEPAIRMERALLAYPASAAALSALLADDPDRAGDVVGRLILRGIPLTDAMALVPTSPRALVSVAKVGEGRAVVGLDRQIEDRLTQIEPRETNGSAPGWTPQDWAALGQLHASSSRWDSAASAWQEAAQGDPGNARLVFELARARFEGKHWQECKEALDTLATMTCDQEVAEASRKLRESFESFESADRTHPSGARIVPSELRAN
jgi:hypothetical protein